MRFKIFEILQTVYVPDFLLTFIFYLLDNMHFFFELYMIKKNSLNNV